MKISLTIDTTEKYSNRRNLESLIDMVLEESEHQSSSSTYEYKDGNKKLQCCTWRFERED